MKRIVFKHGRVIDGYQDKPLQDGLVVIDDGTIVYSGNMDEVVLERYQDAHIVDLSGKTIMPGMIDAHVHLTLAGEPSYLQTLIMEDAKLTVIKGIERAKKALNAGFTTIRCLGEKGQIDVYIKKAIEEGVIVGPNILASGKAITITGGHGDMFPGDIEIDGIATIVDGEDAVRTATRKQLKLGVDNIKLMATGGGMSPGDARISQLTITEMRVAIEEAEKYGKLTAAHAIGEEGINNALEAGVRTLEHGTYISDKGIGIIQKTGAYLVPTLAAFKTLKYGKEGGVPEYHLKKVQAFKDAHFINLRKALDAGVKVITGTDAGTPFNLHGENAYELECLVEAGMAPMQAIHAATRVAAEALKLEDKGMLKEGYVADLIIIDGNPLDDITILQQGKVEQVYKQGDLVYNQK
ncbi:amidohydrolase family protein [Sporosarcina sp. ACRSM]|uniref:metal-dependent hydrolase family protein n=1 Tax=Sporosarcina sp. ACRSM TaxID=2918216 RepID=UPI001EF50579|nr:amidohydrolase family protein [Sporosarcina sp. ACRSM]MCG7335265.1 amidohydrolase family protein [Sporosarcina sp. ACRSM]